MVEFQIIDLAVRMFSSVVLECFLGGATSETIEGKPICIYMTELLACITKQVLTPGNFIFGCSYLNWGLTALDRDVNKRLKLFR